MSRHTAKGNRFESLISKADLALQKEFYLEAISICYAIIEERLRSVLMKVHDPNLGAKHKVDSCLKKIKFVAKNDALLSKYFTSEFLKEIDDWKEERNDVMHELADEGINFPKIVTCAEEGRKLLADLAARTMRWKNEYKMALAKSNQQ